MKLNKKITAAIAVIVIAACAAVMRWAKRLSPRHFWQR